MLDGELIEGVTGVELRMLSQALRVRLA